MTFSSKNREKSRFLGPKSQCILHCFTKSLLRVFCPYRLEKNFKTEFLDVFGRFSAKKILVYSTPSISDVRARVHACMHDRPGVKSLLVLASRRYAHLFFRIWWQTVAEKAKTFVHCFSVLRARARSWRDEAPWLRGFLEGWSMICARSAKVSKGRVIKSDTAGRSTTACKTPLKGESIYFAVFIY